MTLVKKADPLEYDRTDADSWIDFLNETAINVRSPEYGAVGDNVTNDAPAIQLAIDAVSASGGVVYIPAGTYRVTSSIVFPTDRQVRLMGAGPQSTILHVPSGTTATPGVIHLRGTELRSSVEYLQILFDQPNTNVRGDLTAYVPAIYAQSIARFRVQHVRIFLAWTGIDMRGNATAEINDVEMSHFHTGIWIDGSLDSIRIAHLHDWVFAMSATQQEALAHADNCGVRIGRADGVHISNSLFHCGTSVFTFPGVVTAGSANLLITNCAFDTYGGLTLRAGKVRVSDSGFGIRTADGYWGIFAIPPADGSSVQVSNCYFLSDAGSAGPLVEFRGEAAAGFLEVHLQGNHFNTLGGDQYSIVADATAGGFINLSVTGNHFTRTANIAYTDGMLFIGTQVRATVAGNITLDKGTGAGDFLVSTAAGLVVEGNILPGWGLNYASGLQPYSNNNLTASITGNLRERMAAAGYVQASGIDALTDAGTPPFAVKRLTGTLNGSGAGAVAHGIANAFQLGLIVQAWYKGAGGAMGPLNITAVDGTNVNVTGGTAGATFRVTVLYSSNAHAW